MALEDKDVIRRIQRHLVRGINSEEGEVTDVRQTLLNTYLGAEYGNERDGYSRVVTREVLEAVEWALPALLRVFLGGVRAVKFKPSGADDVQQSKLETDVINHWFFDGNEEETGFIVLYVLLKDLLTNPNAYLAIEPVETLETETQTFPQAQPGDIEALEAEGWELAKRNKDGSIEVTRERTEKRIVGSVVPPECCIVDHNHHKLSVDNARFSCIRTQMSKSDLREAGYDEDLLDELEIGDDDSDLWNDEATNRLFYIDEEPDGEGEEDEGDDADKLYWVHKCYMKIDYDEDGIAERRKIVMAGRAILENEPDDYNPIVAGSAYPMPHKHVGMGMAELVADLQKIHTSLVRQLLNNINKQNIQRTFINDAWLLSDNTTMDQLLDGSSEFILGRGQPAPNIMQEPPTPIVAEIVQAIEAFSQSTQLRTGVAPQLTLDPSVLEKSTMGAFVGALDQASQRLELLARLVAETMLVPAFLKYHRLAREYLDEPQQVEVNGQWVTVDPRTWKKRSRMSVNVGLGFNNKQMMLMLLQQLLVIQKEAMPAGLSSAATIYNTLEELTEQANLGHARTYFLDPKEPGWKAPPPPPDPAMITAQATAQALAAEAKRKDAESAAKIAADEETANLNAAKAINDLMKIKGQSELDTAKIAEIRAKITHLNMDKNAQAGPATDSASDEFAAASGQPAPAGETKTKPANGAPS